MLIFIKILCVESQDDDGYFKAEMAQIEQVVSNQYECLHWLKNTTDNLTVQFEQLDKSMRQKLKI